MKIWNFMNGSKKMAYRPSAFAVLLFLSMTQLIAEEVTNTESMPSVEFLEFLGKWETEQGEWLDPVEFENEGLDQLIETTLESKANNEN